MYLMLGLTIFSLKWIVNDFPGLRSVVLLITQAFTASISMWRMAMRKIEKYSSALSEKVFALSERVFALSERVFALDVRVECELMWQGQDGGPGIRPGKRARTAAKTAPRRSQ